MEERVTKLEHDMTDVKTRLAVAEAGLKDMKEDMTSIKNNTTWLLRIVIGAIVAAILGLVVNGGVS